MSVLKLEHGAVALFAVQFEVLMFSKTVVYLSLNLA
jgi:hypothetical protein